MSFAEVLWGMVVFFFWFMIIWMFIQVFADIFRREDLSGWAKAFWILVIFILPFFGILVYMIVRPKNTPQDQRMAAEAEQMQRRMGGASSTDDIAKAHELLQKGAITQAEFDKIKAKALA